MSPILFNIYVSDLEDEMKKEQTNDVTIEKIKTMDNNVCKRYGVSKERREFERNVEEI